MDEIHLEQLYERLKRIEDKIDQLQDFKATTIATTKLASMLISGAAGFLTMVVTSVLNYLINKGNQ